MVVRTPQVTYRSCREACASSRGWSCCPWATLRGCCGCCAPTRWLETRFLCGRTVARIVSPEGWPASLSLAQAGGALGRLVCGGVAMDSPSGEGYVCGSGAGERRNHRRSACQTSTSFDPESALQLPLSANRVPSSWAFSRRRAPQRPWGPGKIKFNACLLYIPEGSCPVPPVKSHCPGLSLLCGGATSRTALAFTTGRRMR